MLALKSNLSMKRNLLNDTNVIIMSVSFSNIDIEQFNLSNSVIDTTLSAFWIDSTNLSMQNVVFSNNHFTGTSIILISRSNVIKIDSCSFLDLDNTLIEVSNSNITMINTTSIAITQI